MSFPVLLCWYSLVWCPGWWSGMLGYTFGKHNRDPSNVIASSLGNYNKIHWHLFLSKDRTVKPTSRNLTSTEFHYFINPPPQGKMQVELSKPHEMSPLPTTQRRHHICLVTHGINIRKCQRSFRATQSPRAHGFESCSGLDFFRFIVNFSLKRDGFSSTKRNGYHEKPKQSRYVRANLAVLNKWSTFILPDILETWACIYSILCAFQVIIDLSKFFFTQTFWQTNATKL